MRNFLAFLAAAVIVLAGAGWYLDWFKLSSKPDGDGHQKVTIDVNTNKAGSDLKTGFEKIEQKIEKDKSADPKTDGGNTEIKVDNKNVEVKTPKADLMLPWKSAGN